MIFSILFALKIAYTDLQFKRIENKDLSILLIFFMMHHRIHNYLISIIVLLFGFLFHKFLGAGDTKLLALILVTRLGKHGLSRAAILISLGCLITFLITLLFRKQRERIPLGPALVLGLFG